MYYGSVHSLIPSSAEAERIFAILRAEYLGVKKVLCVEYRTVH